MPYLVVDGDNREWICESYPSKMYYRNHTVYEFNGSEAELPKGSIEKLIGRKLTLEDEPVELKENI